MRTQNTCLPIDTNHNLNINLTEVLSNCRDHGLLQINKYRFLVDILITCDVINDSYQFRIHLSLASLLKFCKIEVRHINNRLTAY